MKISKDAIFVLSLFTLLIIIFYGLGFYMYDANCREKCLINDDSYTISLNVLLGWQGCSCYKNGNLTRIIHDYEIYQTVKR
jgi:hypothetical protein